MHARGMLGSCRVIVFFFYCESQVLIVERRNRKKNFPLLRYRNVETEKENECRKKIDWIFDDLCDELEAEFVVNRVEIWNPEKRH